MMATQQLGDGTTLLDFLAIARKRWAWILVPMLLMGGVIGYVTWRQPDRYVATSMVLLTDSASQSVLDPRSQNTGFLSREVLNEIALAQSQAVREPVREALGELPEMDISATTETDVLVFAATADSAERAALASNTWAEMYVQVKQEGISANIQAGIENLEGRLGELKEERNELTEPLRSLAGDLDLAEDGEVARLQRRYDQMAAEIEYDLALVESRAAATVSSLAELELQSELSATGLTRIVQVAAPPETTSNTPVSRAVLVGGLLGLLVGCGLAMVAEARDDTIVSPQDVQAATDLPILAAIPTLRSRARKSGPLLADDLQGVVVDAHHKARSALEFSAFGADARLVLVTSPNANEGKTSFAAGLALAFSAVGTSTALVDLDFRRPKIHDLFNLRQTPGLTDLMAQRADAESVTRKTEMSDDLVVVPAGLAPSTPASLVATRAFGEVAAWLQTQAKTVVLDAPPVLSVSDTLTLSRYADAVVLIARVGSTSVSELSETIGTLRQVGAKLAGVVLVGVNDFERYHG